MTLRPASDVALVGDDLARAIREVRAITTNDPDAVAHRAAIVDFARTRPDALHRSCAAGHLTGSALVVDAASDRLLVMLHTKLGMWLQPGGHADGEGNLAAVALREAQEETGIAGLTVLTPAVDCDVHVIPARAGEPEHLHLDVRYVVLAPAGARPRGNHESHELRWVARSELDELATDHSLRRLADAGLQALRR